MPPTSDIPGFIASYRSANDEGRICFAGNGRDAEEFLDRNAAFREQVLDVVLQDISLAPLELVRDLFRAETQCSREAWGIVDGVGLLAENMLRRGGVPFLNDYLEGKFQSFDAHIGSAFTADLPLATTMLNEVRQRLQHSPAAPQAPLWQAGEELFLGWIANLKES